MWTLKNDRTQITERDIQNASHSLRQLFERKDIGFFNISARRGELLQIQDLAAKKRSQYKQIAILGIGGSNLGTLALFEALIPHWIEENKILFFDNVDSRSFYRKLEAIKNPLETLWVIISKSGSTVETLTQADCIDAYLKNS